MGATVASPHPPHHFGEVVGRPLPKGEVTLGHRPRHFSFPSPLGRGLRSLNE
jgi:hypothetical protein